MLRSLLAFALLGALLPNEGLAQDGRPRLTPTAPGSASPNWQRTLPMSDGRTFVTDGALAMDAALARPAAMPADALPPASASSIERFMSAETTAEFALPQLSAQPDGRTYRTPSGIALNQTYIDFLRRALPRARLRTRGDREPVVIVVDGKPVGVVMPVAR